jgi:hypothetical protein
MLQDRVTTPASIFIPSLNDYVSVIGARSEQINGKVHLKIVCRDSQNKEYGFTPNDLEIYAKRCTIPF